MTDAVDFLDQFNVRRASDVTIRFTVLASAPGAEPPAKRQRCDTAHEEQYQQQDQGREQEPGGQPDETSSQGRLRAVVREIYGHSMILTKASEWAERMLSPEWSAVRGQGSQGAPPPQPQAPAPRLLLLRRSAPAADTLRQALPADPHLGPLRRRQAC
jgi:hypothetical protein